ncbi:Putative glutamate and aspartate transporter subunit; periplasmic-binding component of ABC superfamily (modular protein)(Extracellular solute-binding protein, family 3,35-267;Binding-protein-dependent transport systems inner membrane component,349-541) [Magnetospirillum sp. XM-1]|uniref:ABC transporter permease subunit n=1 Tax=Magnetospirillum sp. XM-1 TaxID=1663591 RepID=UPI00073DE112|nr:ABC transporter permease subunit [Magnetospirillum sp. XM-1]CUW38889.1 Putative glutamate and aspartate transporter subunit; periplasmic-binding component of ABC superfamily (modular protein)(Extracellular solute-binding protein, family 3,35-267;Binding-protein-dependent transport systems inner membrane component,349-541) [Magnetospirillum sp. XM-1]
MIARVLMAALLLLATLPARAEDLAGTLKKVGETGTLTLGIRESSYPLSYLDDAQKPVGYHIDICLRLAEAVKARLALPALKVETLPVTSQNRIPLVQNGTVDLECGSTTNNEARSRQVAFAPTTFVTKVRMAVKKSSGITSIAQLAGKPVAITTGTTSVQLVRAHKKGQGVVFKEVYGKDHADSFLLLESDRAVAFIMDDNLLAGLIATSKSPDSYAIVGEVLNVEPIAIMLRRDDPQFKALVDDTVKAMMASGEVDRLYAKWFMSPIPPRGINMHFPMSGQLKSLIKAPADAPAEAFARKTAAQGGYRWNWGIYFEPVPSGDETYLSWLAVALVWTLAISLASWALALVLGVVAGAARTLPDRRVAGAATAYVELFRNIPLLVQMFLWFFVIPELLPASWALWVKQEMPAKEFFIAVICLGLFTSSRVAEQVRAGIESRPKGQRQAALALGMTEAQVFRHVTLPVALRVVIPPLTSEFMNVFKNSSVAFAIGMAELTFVARQMQEESEQGIETLAAVTLLYFLCAFLANRAMALVERRTRVPGLLGVGR